MSVSDGLTVGLITKNEEKLLPQCLESIRPIADEIIVVDTGSRDRTISIAKKFGAKIFHHRWKQNFSKARNVYIREASHRWILSIDTDETIAAKDLPILRTCLKNKTVAGYRLNAAPTPHRWAGCCLGSRLTTIILLKKSAQKPWDSSNIERCVCFKITRFSTVKRSTFMKILPHPSWLPAATSVFLLSSYMTSVVLKGGLSTSTSKDCISPCIF